MIYGYARVSTVRQANDGNSLQEQTRRLKENGAEIIFVDAFTGTKTDRPEFHKLLKTVTKGDTIIATKLDRVSRSASQGSALADELISKGITLHILNMGIMNNTPTGKLIRNIMFSFAEFERDMIIERTSEGKSIRRQTDPNYKEGRREIAIDDDLWAECLSLNRCGRMTVADCCEKLNISRGTWYNRVKKTTSA